MSLPEKNRVLKSSLVQNSVWGIASNIFQVFFVCIFFAIVARKYAPAEFGRFLISNTIYQIVAAFSSMGLGQWFIRQYTVEYDKISFTGKFLKTQLGLGLLFYLVNIGLAYTIYPDGQIRLLCVVLGTNIIFDNFINAIRSLNIAEGKQRNTATILMIDGFLKLLVGCLLFIHPLSMIMLSVLMIVVRILTLGLFFKIGLSNKIKISYLWQAKISYLDLRLLIVNNWQFIIIGSISIIYWKIGNIIISKTLSLTNVADYEIAFRIFSVLLIIPVVGSSTIYPQFIKYVNERNFVKIKALYGNVFVIYTLFAIISYAFIFSFSNMIIPVAFGKSYPGAVLCMQQMFLTFLLLPTVLLQANLIVALGFEKLDMWFNIASLLVNITGCFIGLHYTKDLSVINYSVLGSFVVFHLLQDVVLIKKGITTVAHCLIFYLMLLLTISLYQNFSLKLNPYLIFTFLLAIAGLAGAYIIIRAKRSWVIL